MSSNAHDQHATTLVLRGNHFPFRNPDVRFEVSSADVQTGYGNGATSSPVTFYAHRFILEAFAPKLASLFFSQDEEVATATITNVKPTIFRHLLYYVYGGNVAEEELNAHAKDIINAADKYDMINLKSEAEVAYIKTTKITMDNVLDMLRYADALNLPRLKEAVVENKDDWAALRKKMTAVRFWKCDYCAECFRSFAAAYVHENWCKSVTDLNYYHATKMDSDQIVAKFSLSETLEGWKSDFEYVRQMLNDLMLPGTRRAHAIRLLKRVQNREDYNDFRKSVEAQVTLREGVISETNGQIARLQGCLDEGARRKVVDNLIGDRRERKDEEVRSIEEDYRNEVALAEAKKNRRLAKVEAKYNAEEIEQEYNEKSCVRKWKSNLEDLRDDLGEHQQEMIASLTEVKAHLHLFQSTFKLTEFLKDNSQWNSATQLHDLEWNPQLMQQYEQDLEMLSHVHSLLQNKQWDELAQIVWES